MSPARTDSYVPAFDPYGHSPFDPKYEEDLRYKGALTPSYVDSDGYDNHNSHSRSHSRRHSSRGAGDKHDRKRHRSSTKEDKKSHPPQDYFSRVDEEDDGWDTEYDPRDKYYLSGDDKDYDSLSRSRRGYRRDDYKPVKEEQDVGTDRHRHSSKHHQKPSSRNNPPSRRPMARRNSSERSIRRPTSNRANSSSTFSASRPRTMSRYSSYGSRAGSRYPPNSSRSKSSKGGKGGKGAAPAQEGVNWGQVGRVAVKAGTIAALKYHNIPGNWVGNKGTKVVTAALGAAVVDTFLSKKHPKTKGGVRHAAIRQVAELAIGNMITGPAMKGAERRVH